MFLQFSPWRTTPIELKKVDLGSPPVAMLAAPKMSFLCSFEWDMLELCKYSVTLSRAICLHPTFSEKRPFFDVQTVIESDFERQPYLIYIYSWSARRDLSNGTTLRKTLKKNHVSPKFWCICIHNFDLTRISCQIKMAEFVNFLF